MLSNYIENTEILVRAGKSKYYVQDNRVMREAYIEKTVKAVSVERDGKRSVKSIYQSQLEHACRLSRKCPYLIYITAKLCRDEDAFPIYMKTSDNVYHSEIWECEDNNLLSKAKAAILADLSRHISESDVFRPEYETTQLEYL